MREWGGRGRRRKRGKPRKEVRGGNSEKKNKSVEAAHGRVSWGTELRSGPWGGGELHWVCICARGSVSVICIQICGTQLLLPWSPGLSPQAPATCQAPGRLLSPARLRPWLQMPGMGGKAGGWPAQSKAKRVSVPHPASPILVCCESVVEIACLTSGWLSGEPYCGAPQCQLVGIGSFCSCA